MKIENKTKDKTENKVKTKIKIKDKTNQLLKNMLFNSPIHADALAFTGIYLPDTFEELEKRANDWFSVYITDPVDYYEKEFKNWWLIRKKEIIEEAQKLPPYHGITIKYLEELCKNKANRFQISMNILMYCVADFLYVCGEANRKPNKKQNKDSNKDLNEKTSKEMNKKPNKKINKELDNELRDN